MSRGTTDDDDAFEEIRKAQAEDLKQLPAKVQAAKTRLAAFSRDHRRANLYKCGPMGYKTLKDAHAWPIFASNKKIAAVSKDKAASKDIRADLNGKIFIFCGDITTLEVDAIVNGTNTACLGGLGVDGVIHAAAGGELMDECRLLNGVEKGSAKATSGYKLPADWVFHAVGPTEKQPEFLASAYVAALTLAEGKKLKSIAFPCISTGHFGYPNKEAAETVGKTLRKWLESSPYAAKLEAIVLCLLNEDDVDAYSHVLPSHFPISFA